MIVGLAKWCPKTLDLNKDKSRTKRKQKKKNDQQYIQP